MTTITTVSITPLFPSRLAFVAQDRKLSLLTFSKLTYFPASQMSPMAQISLPLSCLGSGIGRGIHVRILGRVGVAHTTQNPYQQRITQE